MHDYTFFEPVIDATWSFVNHHNHNHHNRHHNHHRWPPSGELIHAPANPEPVQCYTVVKITLQQSGFLDGVG